MSDLVEFLRARLGEDQSLAQQALDTPASDVELYATWPRQRVPFGMTFDPARVLREVEAKRQALELHHPDRHLENWYWTERKCVECGHLWHRIDPNRPSDEIGPETGCRSARLLALPYADHPDYREEWKP